MNVEVKENEVTKVFIVQKLASSRTTPPTSNHAGGSDPTVIGLSSGAVILVILLVLLCICRKKRRRHRIIKRRVISSATTTTSCAPSSVYVIPPYPSKVELRTTEDVTRRYQRSVSNLSAKNQIYLVPFTVLPPDFDFASREVEVRADYVILRDLSLLERYPSNGVVNEAYEPQESYNPHIGNGYIPNHQSGERYQKQAPYNPTFY